MPSSVSSEVSAWSVSSFRPDGMICGPIRPVSAFSVARTSPVTRIRRSSNSSAALPGVWPGACTARGRPGTSICSPSPNVDTSLSGSSGRRRGAAATARSGRTRPGTGRT